LAQRLYTLDSNVSRDYSEDAMAKRKVTIKRDNLKTNIFRVVLEEGRLLDGPPGVSGLMPCS